MVILVCFFFIKNFKPALFTCFIDAYLLHLSFQTKGKCGYIILIWKETLNPILKKNRMVMAIFKLYYFPSHEDFCILDRKIVYYPNLFRKIWITWWKSGTRTLYLVEKACMVETYQLCYTHFLNYIINNAVYVTQIKQLSTTAPKKRLLKLTFLLLRLFAIYAF